MKQKQTQKGEKKMIEIIIKKEENGYIVKCEGHRSKKYSSLEDAKKGTEKTKEIIDKLIGDCQIKL